MGTYIICANIFTTLLSLIAFIYAIKEGLKESASQWGMISLLCIFLGFVILPIMLLLFLFCGIGWVFDCGLDYLIEKYSKKK